MEVRRRFLIKLNGFLVRKRLKPHYMAFFCFSAFEANRELKSQVADDVCVVFVVSLSFVVVCAICIQYSTDQSNLAFLTYI